MNIAVSRAFFLTSAALLAACEPNQETQSNASVTVSAVRASYIAFQDGASDAPWRILPSEKSRPADNVSHTFDVADQQGRYSVVIACGSDSARPHVVLLYVATAAELPKVSRNCTELEERSSGKSQRVYGKVSGIDMNKDEVGLVAVADQTATATEAYALQAPAGTHDMLGMMGVWDQSGARMVVDRYLIARRAQQESARRHSQVDLDFRLKPTPDSINRQLTYVPANHLVSMPIQSQALLSGELIGGGAAFVSKGNSRLPLAAIGPTSLEFKAVPRDRYEAPDRAATNGRGYLQEGEGHVVFLAAYDATSKQLKRQYVVTSDTGVDLAGDTVHLPTAADSQFQVNTEGAIRTAPWRLRWNPYRDTVLGAANLYVLSLVGTTALDANNTSTTKLLSFDVVHHVVLTASRVESNGAGSATLILPNPSTAPDWNTTWSLSNRNAVEAKLFSYVSSNGVDSLYSYLLAKKFQGGMHYIEAVESSRYQPAN